MGCWGMGIAQSDEFCEVYERFMTSYNSGITVKEITSSIIAEYHTEYDAIGIDELWHDVFFALAKAEWMCCEQSEFVLNQVRAFINSGSNIAFYRELGATEKELKLRQKTLKSIGIRFKNPE